MNITTDNICVLAILTLDVRPSSVCVTKQTRIHYELQVLRAETIGRPFEIYAQRFKEALNEMFEGTTLGYLRIDVVVVDDLAQPFEAQQPWTLATTPIKVG